MKNTNEEFLKFESLIDEIKIAMLITKDENGNLVKEFSLAPLLQTNPRMGNVAEPDTRHFLTYDVYTHITFADMEMLKDKKETADEYAQAKNHTIKKGDTLFSSNAIIIFDSLSVNVDKAKYQLKEGDIAVEAHFQVLDIQKKYHANPIYVICDNSIQPIESRVDELGLKFMFWQINPEDGKIQISLFIQLQQNF